MADLTALYREDATPDEIVEAYQAMIDSGDAWRLEGHVGRVANALIQEGRCMLGPERRRDYWGNVVPSRFDVVPGSPGSEQFVRDNDERGE